MPELPTVMKYDLRGPVAPAGNSLAAHLELERVVLAGGEGGHVVEGRRDDLAGGVEELDGQAERRGGRGLEVQRGRCERRSCGVGDEARRGDLDGQAGNGSGDVRLGRIAPATKNPSRSHELEGGTIERVEREEPLRHWQQGGGVPAL